MEVLRYINLMLSLIAIIPTFNLMVGLIKDLRIPNSSKSTGVVLLMVSILFFATAVYNVAIYLMTIFTDVNTHLQAMIRTMLGTIVLIMASQLFNNIRNKLK